MKMIVTMKQLVVDSSIDNVASALWCFDGALVRLGEQTLHPNQALSLLGLDMFKRWRKVI